MASMKRLSTFVNTFVNTFVMASTLVILTTLGSLSWVKGLEGPALLDQSGARWLSKPANQREHVAEQDSKQGWTNGIYFSFRNKTTKVNGGNDHSLRVALKIIRFFWEFFPTWRGGGVLSIPKLYYYPKYSPRIIQNSPKLPQKNW